MLEKEDRTFREIQERSLMQWLAEMEQHPDPAVRGGVRLTREYLAHLDEEILRLKESNALKDQYLKKLAEGKRQKA